MVKPGINPDNSCGKKLLTWTVTFRDCTAPAPTTTFSTVTSLCEKLEITLLDLAKYYVLNNVNCKKVIFGVKSKIHLETLKNIDENIASKVDETIITRIDELNKNNFFLEEEKYLGY